jgi:hypothetical protein
MTKHYNNWGGNLQYPFEGSDTLTETFSQAYQDIFVLSVLNGKTNGSYLEIGCNVPDYTNNTYLLSKTFNWTGVSIDCIESLRESWTTQRSKDVFMACDALTVDYKQILDNNYNGQKVLDYLQCDIEPPSYTLTALKRLPHDEYRFKVITFETDVYTGAEGVRVQEESRKFLSDLGYEMIVGDVLVDGGNPYEDWWVAPELVNMEVACSIKTQALFTTQHPAQLLFR